MKNYLFLAATAAAVLASCSEESFVGDEALGEANGQAAISFNLNVPAMTRADKTGSDAAGDLGSQFIVYAEKNETSGSAPSDGNLVFLNYQVNWTTNTAYTTTSNTKDWEYVGVTHSPEYQSNITTKSGEAASVVASSEAQTIKYWDYSASNYVFTAVSAKQEDITYGRVKIQKNTSGPTVYDKGYTITLAKDDSDNYPSLSNIYFANRNVIVSQNAGTNRDAVNAYGGNVTMRFSNLLSHVRAGVYEDIPGYDITEIKFYVDNGSGQQTTVAQKESTDAFGAICPNITASNYEGTLTVTYYSNSDGATVENYPKVSATDTPETNLILGTNLSTISPSAPLGTTSNNPTWDTAGGAYSDFLPQINNSNNLKLKADYTLYNSVTKEVISVSGATAEVPAAYLQWKPNYKYTYLFKISDNTDGSTGPGVTGLYPITFDAVEAIDEAEYITTVSVPSITTFGVKGDKYVTGGSDYATGSDVYATIVASNSIVDPTDKYFIYKATSSNASYAITEASVAEAIAEKAIGRVTNPVITCTGYTTNVSLVNTVPAEDGTTITLTAGKAIKMEGLTAATYVVAYKASDGSATATTEDYSSTATYYSIEPTTEGFYQLATPNQEEINDWNNSKSNFTTAPTQPVYVYKVIKVVAAP